MNDDTMAEAYFGYREARDVPNQVRRGRGFWPVVAIPIDEAAPPRSEARPKGKGKGKGRGPAHGKGKSSSTPSHFGDKKVRFDAKPSQAQARARATTTTPSSSSSGSCKSRLASRTSCRRCGKIGHWEADCPQQPDSAQRPRTDFPRPPAAQHFAWTSYMIQNVSNIEKWVESAEDEALEHAALMTVTSTMPEGHVIIDCGAATDCVGECALAKNAQYVLARGDVCEATTRTCRQDFRFGGPDQGAVTATYTVSLPCTLAGVKTQLSAYVVPGTTPHLVSRRWLSHHKAAISMDPEALFLTSPSLLRPIPLTLHGSGHIMMSLVDSDPGPTTTYFSTQAIRHPEIYVIADGDDVEAPALEYIQEAPRPPRPPLRLRIRSFLGEVSSYMNVPEAPQLPDDRHARPRLRIRSVNRASTPTPASSTTRTRTSSTTTSSATLATSSTPSSATTATTPPAAKTYRRPSFMKLAMVCMVSVLACTAIAPLITTPNIAVQEPPHVTAELFRDRRACRRPNKRLDYAELWSGWPDGGRVVKAVERFGSIAKPFGLNAGLDLLDIATQKAVLHDMHFIHHPRTLLVCPASGHLSVQSKRRVHPGVPERTATALVEQCLRGGRVIMEHPLGSDMLKTTEMTKVIQEHGLLCTR